MLAAVRLDDSLSKEEAVFADIISDLIEQWGFNRHLGAVWAVLYLRKQPLSPKQIQQTLNLSAGSINSILTELQTWGVVKKIRVAGDRNFYFEPQPTIWKSVSNVLQARELRILQEAIAGLHTLMNDLDKDRSRELAAHQLNRIQHVSEVLEAGIAIATIMIQSPPERMSRLARFIQRIRKL